MREDSLNTTYNTPSINSQLQQNSSHQTHHLHHHQSTLYNIMISSLVQHRHYSTLVPLIYYVLHSIGNPPSFVLGLRSYPVIIIISIMFILLTRNNLTSHYFVSHSSSFTTSTILITVTSF